MRLPRTTGALSGLLIAALGAWAGLVAFVGPYFHYSFGSAQTWHYTSSRLWLCIIPGALAFVAGLMMMGSRRRSGGMLWGWLGIIAGAWLIVGPSLSALWEHSPAGIGRPLGSTHRQALEQIVYFYAPGALIATLSAFALGRFLSRPRLAEEPAAAAAGTVAAVGERRRRRRFARRRREEEAAEPVGAGARQA